MLSALLLAACAAVLADTPCLMHNGKAFFPIGIYDYPGGSFSANGSGNAKDHLQELSSAGFNCYQTDMTKLGNPEIDAAAAYGICVVPTAWLWLTDSQYYVAGSALDSKLTEIKNNPNILMYYTNDESYMCHLNNGSWPSLSVMLAGHQFVESRDPSHPIWYNECPNLPDWDNGTIPDGRAWTGIGDVCSQDMYPVLGSFPSNRLNDVTDSLEDLKRLTDANDAAPYESTKPLLMVLQGCGSHDWDPTKGGPRPTFTESRFMAYISLVHGAKGLAWWGSCCVEPTSQMWTDTKVIAGQLRDLQDVLLTDRLSGFTVSSGLEATLHTYNGDNYLIVCNASSSQLAGTITVPNWNFARNGNTVPVLYEARSVATTSTTWTDSFGPWDVHIYTDKLTIRRPSKLDRGGDGWSDIGLIEPTSAWHTLFRTRSISFTMNYTLGDLSQGDIPVPGCYELSTRGIPGVYHPSTGRWEFLTVSSGFTQTAAYTNGQPGDVPVSGDYDGDLRDDIAVYSPSSGTWRVLTSSSGFIDCVTYHLGSPGDKPVPADFDGDGKLDPAVYRPWTSEWFVLISSSGYTQTLHYQFGQVNDRPVPADFDGDGKADPAICRMGDPMTWSFMRSMGNNPPTSTFTLGTSSTGDVPIVADYDGDGRADMAVYRPRSPSQWLTLSSLLNHQSGSTISFGSANYVLVGGAGRVGEDRTPPLKPVVSDQSQATVSRDALSASWSTSDPESSVKEYVYAIGTTVGASDVVPWTYAGSLQSVTRTGLALAVGSTYYCSVRAANPDGYWSDVGTSSGCTVVAAINLGDSLSKADNASVNIPCAVVTAGSDQLQYDCYVEAIDRTQGIRVHGGSSLKCKAGDLVSVSGPIKTSSGSRYISNSGNLTQLTGVKPVVRPLCMKNKDLGGKYPYASPSISIGSGAYTVGLLVSVNGRVTASGSNWFYIDDGCKRSDKSAHTGVKISCSGLASGNQAIPIPAVGKYVKVSGVVSTYSITGGYAPQIRPRNSADVVTIQ